MITSVKVAVSGLFLATAVGCASSHPSAQPSSDLPQHTHAYQDETSANEVALATPSSIVMEHEHLHEQLDAAMAVGGETGLAAKKVADVLGPHFKEEEAYAMPPLGLLEAIAHSMPLSEEQIRGAIEMADKLRANLPQMLEEHQQIHAALAELARAARQENRPAQQEFAEALMMHAKNEEQVLYPTTLLIGKYLQLQEDAHSSGANPDRK
jgi:hypothetical protein